MESKSKEPGRRILQLAVRDAISSKLSLNSSFKRELDRRKQCRWKTNEKKENPKESLVTKEMAEIFRSMKKEKVKISYNSETNSSDKPSRQKAMIMSVPDPSISKNNFETNIHLFNDSNGSLTKELSSEQKKSVSTEYLTSANLLEKPSSESLIINENTKEKFYISPPYYPESFFTPINTDIYPENTINSLFVENKKNHISNTLPHLNTSANPENKRQGLDFNQYYGSFSQENLVSSRDILLTSNNSEKYIGELQNSQILLLESKKSTYNVYKYKQLSPKKKDENEYINNLIDSFVNKRCRSSTEKIEKSIHKEHSISKAQKVDDSAFNADILSSPLDKASMHKSQNTCDFPTIFLNFKSNVCKKEDNIIEKESTSLTEKNDGVLSSHNEISVAVLCEFFKLQAMLN